MKGLKTGLSHAEIIAQLRLGLSASQQADDNLMSDAADLLSTLSPPNTIANAGEETIPVRADVVRFLLGQAPLDGAWLGDVDPMRRRRTFWWRKYLPEVAASPAAPEGE